MKSPEDLRRKFIRRWENADFRESQLLGGKDVWPIFLPIGRPSPRVMSSDLDAVRKHVERWRKVSVGKVVWKPISYRATAEPVDMPSQWHLPAPSEWIKACRDPIISTEFDSLTAFVEQTDVRFHSLLIRRRSLWRGRPEAEVIQATQLALELQPCCAEGYPLRMISMVGIDTKFFERNEKLITTLLDLLFDGEPGKLGLEVFLGAAIEKDHWLLVADLDGDLLPFSKLRVPGSELRKEELPARRILIVENESSLHQLPPLRDTIAVLGAGFDLTWTAAEWLHAKKVAYWGDIDTWGLQFLATARSSISHLTPLMMDSEVFEEYQNSAVPEPVSASCEPAKGLNQNEKALYLQLLKIDRGRLEQEFLPISFVHKTILEWLT